VTAVQGALAKWAVCAGRDFFPDLAPAAEGSADAAVNPVLIKVVDTYPNTGCGNAPGCTIGNTIYMKGNYGGTTDFTTAIGQARIAHEVGHAALGLEHDGCQGLMTGGIFTNEDISALPTHCEVADFLACDPLQDSDGDGTPNSCPSDPRQEFAISGQLRGLTQGGQATLYYNAGSGPARNQPFYNGRYSFSWPAMDPGEAWQLRVEAAPTGCSCNPQNTEDTNPGSDIRLDITCTCSTPPGPGEPKGPFKAYADDCVGFGAPCSSDIAWFAWAWNFPSDPNSPPPSIPCTPQEQPTDFFCVDKNGNGELEDNECTSTETIDVCPARSSAATEAGGSVPGVLHGPTLLLTSPTRQQVVRGRVWVEGWAVDRESVAEVAALIDFHRVELDWFEMGRPSTDSCQALGGASPYCSSSAGFRGMLDTNSLPVGNRLLAVTTRDNLADWSYLSIIERVVNVQRCQGTTPQVVILSPSIGSNLAGNVTVSSSILAESDVMRAELLVDGLKIAEDDSSPYSFTWNTRQYPNGAHTVSIRALDGCDNTGTSNPVNVNVANTQGAPTVSIVQPAQGAMLSGSVLVAASASDPQGIKQVEFFVDDVLKSTDISAPYRWTWNTAGYSSGVHVLKARALDNNLVEGFSNPVEVLVGAFPRIRVTLNPEGTQVNAGSSTNVGSAPAGTTISRGFRIENTGTAAMVIQNPSTLLSGSTTCFQQESSPSATIAAGSSSVFSVRFGCGTEGSYSTSLRIESNDPQTAQFVASLSGTVTVMVNQPPAVYVDAPPAGQVVSGTALPFEGWATDGGGVQSLQVLVDGQALQPAPTIQSVSRGDVCSAVPVGDPNCPMVGFRALVDTTLIADGVHSLGIVATDGSGATGSASVTIDVRNATSGIKKTFVAAEDTFIEQADPTSTHGTSSRIVVHGGEPGLGRLKYGILKFNVSSIGGTVTSARLKLREDYGRSVGHLAIWRITGGPWYESSFTWSQFATGILGFSLYSTVFDLPASTTSSIDVTGLVSGNGEVSIGLSTLNDIDYYFASSESFISSKRPVLEVTYSP